jgi:hypothetical protein
MKVTEQEVFMLFFAIIWGTVANVQPRWKAFQWPLFLRHKPARHRVCLSVLFLNVGPLLLFAYVFWALGFHNDAAERPILHLIIHGILPAFGVFACYRLWLSTIEAWPAAFYSPKGGVDTKYEHVEPTYRIDANGRDLSEPQLPIVDLGRDTACPNFVTAVFYILVALGAPWIPM